MAVKTFYLFGEDSPTTREVNVGADVNDLQDLKAVVADHFAVVEPSGT